MRTLSSALMLLFLVVPARSSAAEAGQSAARAGSGSSLAVVGGRLIDGYGGLPLENAVVLIEGDKIAGVGQVGQLALIRK
jgi:hypothetical protein